MKLSNFVYYKQEYSNFYDSSKILYDLKPNLKKRLIKKTYQTYIYSLQIIFIKTRNEI